MASVTRSRQAEVPAQRQHHHRPHSGGIVAHTRSGQNILQQANPTRSKRALESSVHDFDAIKRKKAKITVEILSRHPPIPSKNPSASANATSQPAVARVPRPAHVTQPAPEDPPALTKHQEKVINGIRHELDRLQPNSADTKEQGRKLRSQEATRFKSELAAYFPDYDEVIGNEPKEQHILNLETPIIVIDPISDQKRQIPPLFSTAASRAVQPAPKYTVRSYSDALHNDLFDAQRIDFSFLEARYKGKVPLDPLPDSYFEPAHKKAERLERSIRNSEKGRAQHEKDQIIRLLEGLQGHDWLRTMGVSGITESRKKTFEPAREYFIKGCKAIIEKFRLWGLEEKRRKQEKDRVLAEEAKSREDEEDREEEEADDEDEEDDEEEEEEQEEEDNDQENESLEDEDPEDGSGDGREGDVASESDPPDYSDVDASIAKQLREEALARSTLAAKAASKRPKSPQEDQNPTPAEPQPPKEFTSFFRKKYQRDAALSPSRRRGRSVVAWGQTLPEPSEVDFDLPEEYRDQDTLKAHARRRRRDRRGH